MSHCVNIDYLSEYMATNSVPFSIAKYVRTRSIPEINQVIFQDELKTTIVIWNDGTKTVVHCMETDEFVPEVGFAMAVTKKVFGDRNKYLKIVEKASHQKVFKK